MIKKTQVDVDDVVTYKSMSEEEMLNRLEQSRRSGENDNYMSAEEVITELKQKYSL